MAEGALNLTAVSFAHNPFQPKFKPCGLFLEAVLHLLEHILDDRHTVPEFHQSLDDSFNVLNVCLSQEVHLLNIKLVYHKVFFLCKSQWGSKAFICSLRSFLPVRRSESAS